MTDERRGKRVEDLPDWARRLYEDYGSPELDGLGDVFQGPLMDRKSGLRKDDIIEILHADIDTFGQVGDAAISWATT